MKPTWNHGPQPFVPSPHALPFPTSHLHPTPGGHVVVTCATGHSSIPHQVAASEAVVEVESGGLKSYHVDCQVSFILTCSARIPFSLNCSLCNPTPSFGIYNDSVETIFFLQHFFFRDSCSGFYVVVSAHSPLSLSLFLPFYNITPPTSLALAFASIRSA